MVQAAVNAKINFNSLDLISGIGGLPYAVVLTWLQASYRGTKFCFCLYFSFKLDYSAIIDACCRKDPQLNALSQSTEHPGLKNSHNIIIAIGTHSFMLDNDIMLIEKDVN